MLKNAKEMKIFRIFLKPSIAQRLFGYFSTIFIIIFTLSTMIESMIIGALLTLPSELQEEFLTLANKAESFITTDDLTGLKAWEETQEYTLYIVDEHNQSITGREIHPYVKSKMSFSHQFNQPMNNWVSKPMVVLHLISGEHLMLQLPWQLHPAEKAKAYLWAVRIGVTTLFLALVSWLFSKHLQRPLMRLQDLTRQLASGDLSVRASSKLNSNIKEFQNLAIDFDHMANQIEKLVFSHKKLLRNISHELRAPLTRQSLAMHLLSSRLQPEQLKHFDEIESNVNEMNELIHQTLEFSRLEGRHYQVRLKRTPLTPLISNIVGEISKQAGKEQNIHFSSEDNNITALIDHGLFTSVLQNALCNALKYAGKNCQVQVSLYQHDTHSILSISDNGPGLFETELSQIFEPFYQVDNSRSKDVQGYGLGMAIMKESIDQMNGEIIAKSPIGKGLTITCSLSP
jgi:signal transduction histidine kinase